MLSINDLKVGTFFKLEGNPYLVVRAQHVKMGRGGAILKIKIRHLINGNVLDKTFKSSDKFEEASLEKKEASFLYTDEKSCHFMNSQTFDQFYLTREQIENKINFLKEGQIYKTIYFEDNPVDIELPKKIELKVVEAPPGVRGDTAQGSVTKVVKLETGLKINVPLFIKQGDIIRVNTETGQYVGRV
jgi:elongation factor P